jgi:hypothetical protein
MAVGDEMAVQGKFYGNFGHVIIDTLKVMGVGI